MLQLYFKRAKLFLSDHEGKSRRFVGPRSDHAIPVPDWVKDTPGYKYGIKDGSIIDLTPPKPLAAVTVPEKSKELDVEIGELSTEISESEEELKTQADLEDELVQGSQRPPNVLPGAQPGSNIRASAKKRA
jgi:hypothetical protein